MQQIIISIIVATRNRKENISRFIDNLVSINPGPRVELIVVDNGSSDSTPAYLQSLSIPVSLQTLEQVVPGKSRSLNKGIKHANGDILLFVDDDVIFEQNYFSSLIKTVELYPGVNILGGRISIDASRVPNWIKESYNLRTLLTSEQELGNEIFLYEDGEYPVGPNIAVRRAVLKGLEAPWPEMIGPGTNVPVGDEIGFLRKISKACDKDRLYSPECAVRHIPETYYSGLRDVARRCYQAGLAASLLRLPAQRKEDGSSTLIKIVLSRLRSARSVREFVCIVIRYAGYLYGKHLYGKPQQALK